VSDEMISVDDAMKLILESTVPMAGERVLVDDSMGRVLAGPVTAIRDVPPLDNSAMDGFALSAFDTESASENTPARLPIARTIPAGDPPGPVVSHGEAVRIMTGAPVPEGIDTVIPVELTKVEGDTLILAEPFPAGKNIRSAGEDIETGIDILSRGRQLIPADLGIIASQGIQEVDVYARPEVAILATGDEVIPLGQEPGVGQIYSSNSHALAAQVKECGAVPRQLGIAGDDPDHLAGMVEDGLGSDVLITSGGISMGDFDYLKEVFERLGVNIMFWKVAQKPGKPMTFGSRGGKLVFALPGNPVSTMLSFELYARPALLKMMGHLRLFRPIVRAVLEKEVIKKRGRRNYIRGIVRHEGGTLYVRTTGEQGSGILRSMSAANGIIVLPEDSAGARAGESVDVYLLDSEGALL